MSGVREVVYFTTAFPGRGAGQLQIARMCDAFAGNGVQVELVRSGQLWSSANRIKEFYGLKRGFKVTTLAGFPWLRNYDPIFCISLIQFVHAVVKQDVWRDSIFYGRSPAILPLSLVLRLKQKIRRGFFPRCFCEVHEDLGDRGLKLLSLADGIVVISESLKEELLRQGIAPGKVLVARDAVDLDLYIPLLGRRKEDLRSEVGLPPDKKLVVFTGHLYQDRGIEVLVESLKYLDDRVMAVLVGGVPTDIRRVKKLVGELNSGERVKLVGYRPAWQIPVYQISADVLIIPYSSKWRIKQWSSPLKLFEYMAARNPIVATDFPSLREILADGKNCVLVPPDSPQALANGVRRVLEEPALASAIATQAFNDVQHHTWDKRAVDVLDFIARKSI